MNFLQGSSFFHRQPNLNKSIISNDFFFLLLHVPPRFLCFEVRLREIRFRLSYSNFKML